MTMDLKKKAQWALDHMESIKKQRVLVVGDLGMDRYIEGSVKRISPEAPVPVLNVNSRSRKLGLSGNVAANIQSLGGISHLVSLYGSDPEACEIDQLFNERQISSELIVKSEARPTTCKTRLLSGHHHLLRFDDEKTFPLTAAEKKQLKANIEAGLQTADIAILQDYGKGVIDSDTAQFLIQKAREKGLKVLVDPHRHSPLPWYKGAFLMTPNQSEATDLCHGLRQDLKEPSLEDQGSLLMEATGSEHMMITLGAQGIRLFAKGQQFSVPTLAQDVFDVTGAGDTVVATLALAMAAQWPLEEAGFLANCAAGIVVGHIGALSCPRGGLVTRLESLATTSV